MARKINKKIIIYFFILLSFFHTVLRPSPDSALSAYRLICIIPFLLLVIVYFNYLKKELLIFTILFAYNIVLSLMFYNRIDQTISLTIHIGFIFMLYVFMKILWLKDKNFNSNFFAFLDAFTLFTLAVSYLEMILNFHLPNISISRSPLSVNAFYWTENELGSSLAIMMPLYIYIFFEKKNVRDFIKIVAIFYILYRNDCKLAIIGVLTAFLIYFLIKNVKRVSSVRGYLFLIITILASSIVLLYIWNPTIRFRNYDLDLNELIFEAVIKIIHLQVYGQAGSIGDRTDAIIYGLIELKESFGLGIGFGNSLIMLQKEQYQLQTAKSMHNFIFQMLTETGYAAMIIFGIIIMKLYHKLLKDKRNRVTLISIMFAGSFIFISSQSSIGIFSNYFLWVTVIYTFLINFRHREKNNMKVVNHV